MPTWTCCSLLATQLSFQERWHDYYLCWDLFFYSHDVLHAAPVLLEGIPNSVSFFWKRKHELNQCIPVPIHVLISSMDIPCDMVERCWAFQPSTVSQFSLLEWQIAASLPAEESVHMGNTICGHVYVLVPITDYVLQLTQLHQNLKYLKYEMLIKFKQLAPS